MQAHCLTCKTKRDMNNETIVTASNGKRMAKGQCATCGRKIQTFLPGSSS